MSHTPGPWRATGPTGEKMQSYSQPWGVTGTGEHQMQLVCGCFGDIGGAVVAEANARLIAAAPTLLEAAERALELIEKGAPGWGVAKDLLRAAIYEARGQ